MNKKSFIKIVSIFFILFLMQGVYIALHQSNHTLLRDFATITKSYQPAFYTETAYLRHRNLHSVEPLFDSHPGLRERAFGTFIQSSPTK